MNAVIYVTMQNNLGWGLALNEKGRFFYDNESLAHLICFCIFLSGLALAVDEAMACSFRFLLSAAGAAIIISFFSSSCVNSSPGAAKPYVQYEPFPYLGMSATYAALATQSISNSGPTTVYGDIGVSPEGTLSGLGSLKRTGGVNHQNDDNAKLAQSHSNHAYDNLKGLACDVNLSGQDLGGKVLTPGNYCFNANAELNGMLTLDARGDPHANFIFQINGSLVTGNSANVRMVNSGESCLVFWQVVGSVRLAPYTNFVGGVLSMGDIALGYGAKLNGKLISKKGSITLDSDEIYNNFCPWN